MRQRSDHLGEDREGISEIAAPDSRGGGGLVRDRRLAAGVRTRHHGSIAVAGHFFAALALLGGHFGGLRETSGQRQGEEYGCQGNCCEMGCSAQHFYSTPTVKLLATVPEKPKVTGKAEGWRRFPPMRVIRTQSSQ